MRLSLRVALIVLLIVAAAVLFAEDGVAEAPIRALVADQAAAWNAGDGPAYTRHLAPDAWLTNIFGMIMYRAPAFAKRHAEILATLIGDN
jgi:ketosteroid isomerase-like protein